MPRSAIHPPEPTDTVSGLRRPPISNVCKEAITQTLASCPYHRLCGVWRRCTLDVWQTHPRPQEREDDAQSTALGTPSSPTRYQPRGGPAAKWWDLGLAEFVAEAIETANPTGRAGAERIRVVLAHFGGWCREEGLPLDRRAVFDPSVLERYTACDQRSATTRASYRSVLRRLGPVLAPANGWEPPPVRTRYRSVPAPYSDEEAAMLELIIADQPTPRSRRIAEAVWVLGAGAGLDGRWLTRVTPDDVSMIDGVTVIEVPSPVARPVPVRRRFEERLWTLVRSAGDEPLVGTGGSGSNASNRLQAQIRHPEGSTTTRLTAKRARSTWLVAHIAAGVRLPELLAAAGIQDVSGLRDLAQYVEPLAPDEARRCLAGPS